MFAAGTQTALGRFEFEDPLTLTCIAAPVPPGLLALRLWWWKRRTFGKSWLHLAPAEWHAIGRVAGTLVTALEIATREARVGDRPVRLGLIGAVRTRRRYRRMGLGRETMRQTVRHVRDRLGCDYSFLMCDEPTSQFYVRCGFVRVPNRLIVDQPDGGRELDFAVMIAPGKSRDPFPVGALDLCGLPF